MRPLESQSAVSFKLGFRSACEVELFHLVGILEGDEWANEELSLTATFIPACPTVKFTQNMLEAQVYHINYKSNHLMEIQIFNPDAPKNQWADDPRLEFIRLEYRLRNSQAWSAGIGLDGQALEFKNKESMFG